MKFLTYLLPLGLLVPALSFGASINYTAAAMPNVSGFSQQIIFGGTSMTTDGSVLTMTTATARGLWFGSTSLTSSSAAGNYLAVDARFSSGATEWFIYFGDGTNLALWELGGNYLAWEDSSGMSANVAQDLSTAFHRFEMWMQSGIVSYALDGNLLYSGAAISYSPTQLLIGDSSGPTIGGTGSMFIDGVTFLGGANYSSAPAIPDGVPEPSSLLLALAGVGMLARRLARNHR